MTRLLENKSMGWIVYLLIFASAHVWSENIDTELIGAAGKGTLPDL